MVLTEIADAALELVGVKALSQDSSTEDQTKAGVVAEQVYDRLVGKGLAVFDSGSVPSWAQGPFIDLVAADLLPVYGVSAERAQIVAAKAAGAIGRLTEQIAQNRPRLPVRARYF